MLLSLRLTQSYYQPPPATPSYMYWAGNSYAEYTFAYSEVCALDVGVKYIFIVFARLAIKDMALLMHHDRHYIMPQHQRPTGQYGHDF